MIFAICLKQTGFSISNLAFWFLQVAQPEKTRKTSRKPGNRETWEPMSDFPETSQICMLRKLEKPMET